MTAQVSLTVRLNKLHFIPSCQRSALSLRNLSKLFAFSLQHLSLEIIGSDKEQRRIEGGNVAPQKCTFSVPIQLLAMPWIGQGRSYEGYFQHEKGYKKKVETGKIDSLRALAWSFGREKAFSLAAAAARGRLHFSLVTRFYFSNTTNSSRFSCILATVVMTFLALYCNAFGLHITIILFLLFFKHAKKYLWIETCFL